jgi:hypothetical protein
MAGARYQSIAAPQSLDNLVHSQTGCAALWIFHALGIRFSSQFKKFWR